MKIYQALLITALLLLSFITRGICQEEHYIQSGKDKIFVRTYGKGDPILIINGGPGMNSEGFTYLAKVLGKTHRTILFDQRGTGKSVLPVNDSSTITMELMAQDMEAIRTHFGIKKWTVFGHSFGGMLGSFYTSKFPEYVNGFILSSSGGVDLQLFSILDITGHLSAVELDSFNVWNKKILAGDTSLVAKRSRAKWLAPAYLYKKTNEHLDLIAERLTQVDYSINFLVVQDMNRIGFDCTPQLKRFTEPVLIIQGKQDIIPVKIARNAAKVFTHKKLVLLDSCGHYGWLDQPQKYFIEIDRFLNRLKWS